MIDNISHVWLIRVVDQFTFSHGSNWNKHGGYVTLAAPSSVISVDLQKKKTEQKNAHKT